MLLGAVAISLPLQIATSNVAGIPHPERLLFLTLGLWLTGVMLMYAFKRLGASNRTSTVFSFFLLVGISRGFLVLRLFPLLLGWIVLAAGVLTLAALVSRMPSDVLVSAVLVASSVFLLSSSVVGLYRTSQDWGESAVIHTYFEIAEEPINTQDIFLVVLDGYAGMVAMRDTFGIETPAWVGGLKQRGFDVPGSAWSSYHSTSASIPSLLNMSYPLETGRQVTRSTRSDLYEIIGGDNVLTETLSSWGYQTTMLESGWSGSSCGSMVDTCVPSAFLDEPTYFTLEYSVVGPQILERYGYAFTAGAQRSMLWLLDSAPLITSNQRPDFVFAHIMAPHGPFLLDRHCEVRYIPEAKGVGFQRAGVDKQIREALYLEQAGCLDRFMFDLADSIPENATLVFIADHGTDSRRQLKQQPTDWDTEDIAERFNILMATRSPDCRMPNQIQIPNVFRLILACMTDTKATELAPKMFVYGRGSEVMMIDSLFVERLMSGSRTASTSPSPSNP